MRAVVILALLLPALADAHELGLGLVRVESDGRVYRVEATPDRLRLVCKSGCEGPHPARFEIEGLAPGEDALVELVGPGERRTVRVGAGGASFERPAAFGYLALGLEHIALGLDHLLFVLALVLLGGGVRDRVLSVSAFTLGHSLTLGATALGWFAPSAAPVEMAIAASVVLVARRVALGARDGAPGYGLVFGLLHGFGFAGALLDLGLPPGEVPLALLGFNLGVELGQLGFVLLFSALAALARRAELHAAPRVIAHGIGGFAIAICIDRAGALL